MQNLNQYAFNAAGEKITWEEWYASVRGEKYVQQLSKKSGYFCFDGKHTFNHVSASHELYALSHNAQPAQVAARSAEGGAGAAFAATPTNNMGVSSATERDIVELVISDKGDVLEVPIRLGHGDDSSFVDWLNMTFLKTTALRYTTHLSGLTNDACVMAISKRLEYLFGFGVTEKRPSGSNFYKESYILGDNWGQVCIGGQQDTVLVMLNGSGCTAAAEGWEERVFTFLSEECIAPRITRIDLTFDDIEGKLYSVDQAKEDHLNGFYTLNGRRTPTGECIGDWDRINGKGRTKTVGLRGSGKYLRVYEKGMQLGCKFHPWVRIELEMKSSQVCIPFDTLLKAGAYLSAAYPALNWISEHKAERIKTSKKEIEVNINKAIEVVRHQFGNHINVLMQMFSPEKLLQLITRNDKIPERLKVKDFRFAPLAMHKSEYEYMDTETIFDMTDVPEAEVQAIPMNHKYDSLLEEWLPTFDVNESLANFQKMNKLGEFAKCPF